MRDLSIALSLILAQAAFSTAHAQSVEPASLDAGKILVANRDLGDPNFAKTVVLLVEYGDDGVVGLVLNRRSDVPISRAFGGVRAAKDRSDPVYEGGPVSQTEVLALLRAKTAPDDAKHVFGDIYLVTNKEPLEKTMASSEKSAFHIYLGYAGWTAEQLEHEVELGAWFIFHGDAGAIFDADPDSLWSRMIRQTELHVARR